MKDERHVVNFKGRTIIIQEREDGSGIDDEGTIYPHMFDPGYCGVEPFATGKGDPFWKTVCKAHDGAFNRMKDGYADSESDNWETFKTFTGDVATQMLGAAYTLVAGPIYILVGGIGGMARWAWLSRK